MKSNNDFLTKMEDLVKQVVAYNNIPCYRIDSITETHTGTEGVTIATPIVRIVGIFEDTTTKAANVLNSEFDLSQVVSENSYNDSFASSGLTYKATLKANRLDLSEYKLLNPQQFEIRISSILQDVYSAMEADLGGESGSVPSNVKRDFYRVGAFLEMADIEFQKIRNKVQNSDSVTERASGIPNVPKFENNTAQSTPNVNTATPATETSNRIANVEAMDMSVDSFDSLAVGIDHIEDTNGYHDSAYFNTVSPKQDTPKAPEPIEENTFQDFATQGSAVSEPREQETEMASNGFAESNVSSEKSNNTGNQVDLKIDNVETFNMNVDGMVGAAPLGIQEEDNAHEEINSFQEEVNEPELHNEPEASVNEELETLRTSTIASFEDKVDEDEEEVVDENSPMTEKTLKEYVANSKVVKEVDAMIAERAGAKINEEIDIEGDVDRLRFLKVLTLRQLHDRITDNKEDIVMFAEKWIGKDNGGSFDSGICLFYLEYLLVGKKNDPAFSVEYVLKFISDNDYSARYIIPTYNSIRQTNEPSNFAHLTLK